MRTKYTQEALNNMKEARANNTHVSQRRFARNVFNLVRPGYLGTDISYGSADSTPTLSSQLGYPSEVAIQHLIRRIDTQVRKDIEVAATVTNSATLNRKKTRLPDGRKARARKTASARAMSRTGN